MTKGDSTRLVEIDSLRGLAAVAVMAFHYTTKYDEVYGFVSPLSFYVPWGYLGVNLFFVISGFVIFMTLERTKVPTDFIVSRASRLYPAYWVAIVLTYCVTHWLGLPGKEVSWQTAALNAPMVQMLFAIPLVDGVYWTLLVELLFYAIAFTLFVTRSMHRVLYVVAALLSLRLVYSATSHFANVDLPWRIQQLLILDYVPWFALGIVAFRLVRNRRVGRRANLATAAFAISVLAIIESMMLATVALVCFIAVWGAAAGHLSLLRLRWLVLLGTISYPLYLLHENIGWSILRQLQQHGWTPLPAITLTTGLVLALAAAVSFAVERPAMRWIRDKYKRSRQYLSGRTAS